MPNFPVLAGQRARAGDFPYKYVKFKAGAEGVTNSNVLQNDNDLFADIGVGVWEFNVFLAGIATTNVPDIRYAWSTTGTITQMSRGVHGPAVSATAVNGSTDPRMQAALVLATAAASGTPEAANYALIWEHTFVECTVAGRMQFQWAQNTATAATTTTLGVESHMTWQRVVEL
jgi:hypothetical protein